VSEWTIYEKRSCSKCRQLHDLLTERAVLARPVERVLDLLDG